MGFAEKTTILNVDGDQDRRGVKSRLLQQAGYRVIDAASKTSALQLAAEVHPALVLLSADFANGDELRRAIKNQCASADPVFLQCRVPGDLTEFAAEARVNGADECISEPIEADALISATRALLRVREQENENRRLRAALAESQAARQLSDQRLRELARLTPEIVFRATPAGRFDFLNPHWHQYTGEPEQCAVDVGWSLIHPEDIERVRNSWESAVHKGTLHEVEFRLRDKEGSYHWHVSRSVPIKDADGHITEWIGTTAEVDSTRRLNDALREGEERLSLAGQTARFGNYDADIESQLIQCSPELSAIAGLDRHEPIAFASALNIVHPDDRDATRESLLNALIPGTGGTFTCGFRIVRPDREVCWVILRGIVHFAESGSKQAVRVLGTLTDITARRRAEDQLRDQNNRLRLLAKAAEQLLVAGDAKSVTRDLFATLRQFVDLDGYLHYDVDESTKSLVLQESAGMPAELVRAWARIGFDRTYCGAVAATRAPLLVEALEQREDPKAKRLWQAGYRAYVCHPLLIGDRLLGTLAFASKHRDVFEPDEIESLRTVCQYVAMTKDRLRLLEQARQQADRLARSELRLQLALDAAEVGIYEWQLQTVQAIWDDRLRAHWGMRAGAPVTYDIFMGAIHPADRAGAQAAMEPALDPDGDRQFDTEFRVIGNDDGVERWIRTRGQVFYQNGRAVQLLGTTIDLTERKRAELELITLRDRLAADLADMTRLHELGTALLVENDLSAVFDHVLAACNKLFGTDKGSVQLYDEADRCLRLVAHRGFDQAFIARFATVYADSTCVCGMALAQHRRIVIEDLSQAPEIGEAGFLRACGVAAVQSTPLCTQGGKMLGMLSTHFSDVRRPSERELRLLDLYVQQAERVLERRQAERELRESEERLALAVAASRSGVWDLDLVSGRVQLTESFRALHGFSADEPLNYKKWLLHLSKPDRRRLLRYNEELFRSGADFNFEYRWRHPVSGERWLMAVGRMVRDAEGRPARLVGVNSDITERKLSELARARLAAIVANSQDAIFSIDLKGTIASWNKGAENLYGYAVSEILGQSVALLSPQEHTDDALSVRARIIRGEPIENYETRGRRKDGTKFDVARTISPIKNSRGEVIGASEIARDITARVAAQDTLWRSEEQLRLAQSAAHVGIWDWEPDSNRLSWTPEMLNLYGVSRAVEHYDDWRKLVHVDDLARVEIERKEAIRRHEVFNVEYRILHSSGELRWISSRGQGYYDDDGKLLRVLGINMDVSESRRAEQDLLKFQALVESSLDYIGMAEPDGNGIYLNPAGRALVGADNLEQIRQRRPADFIADESRGFFQATVLPELATHGVWEGELPLRHLKTGAAIQAYRTFFLVKDPVTGKPMCIANVTRDIRERKRAEAQLRESEQRFKALANSAPVLIWINGPDGGAQFCNQAYRAFVGVADDSELAGFRWADYLHPDDRAEYAATYSQALGRWDRFEFDFRIRRADGQYRWMKSLAMPRFTETGAFLGYAGCTIDIHDTKLAEVQLALLGALVNSSQDAIYSFTLDTKIVSWNHAAEMLFGWSEAEVLGKKWTDFVSPDDGDELASVIDRIRSGERVTRFETKRRHKGGNIFDVALTFSPVVAQEKIVAISAIARDISERKHAEESREQQARLLELSLDAIIVWNYASGAIEYWNEGAEKLYGYTAREVFGRSVHNVLKSSFLGSDGEKTLQESGEWDGRLIHTQKSAGRVAVLSRMQRITRPQGDIVLEVNRDITIIEEAEEAVAQAAAHIKAVVDTAVDGIITIDEHGSIESFNPAAEKIFGYSRTEIVGRNITLLMPGLAGKIDVQKREAAGGVREIIGRRRDGDEFTVELGLSETRSGQARFFTCLVRDATARKESERALVEAKNSADAANRAKSEFLANMSHEIRNPMTGIMGYADILLARLQDRGAIECVRTIKESGQYLLQIINDLLDLAKIEAQGMELENEEVHLPTFLTDVYTLMEGAARAKGLPLTLKYDGVIPYEIESDSKRLRQILINLLGNAIKFTDRGGVELAVHFDIDTGELQFRVNDSGIGMTEEQQQNLFKPFTQGDSSMTRIYGGTGLGLAITKRLVEALDGRIEVTSMPARGSTFEVSLPVRVLSGSAFRSSEMHATKPPRQRLAGVRVMIVEDQPDIRRLMEYFIVEAGGIVTTFSGGEAAVRAVQERLDDFDVILMDIQMPRMDGHESTRRIRALGFTKAIIAVTAGAMAGDQAACLAAGCSDYISKPIDMTKLLESIARAVAAQLSWTKQEQRQQPTLWEERDSEGANGKPDGVHTSSRPEAERRRVLVVDDRPVALNATRSLLEMHGFEVRAASSGQAAIRIAGDFRPDYIFLDISLPDISGYEVFRRLKESVDLAHTKFIALSGHGREENLRARKAGFDAYMMKPVDIQEMEKLITGGAQTFEG